MEEKEVHGTTVMTVLVSACLRDGACDSTSTFKLVDRSLGKLEHTLLKWEGTPIP
jgi:hypothetical protein